jgi:hypothetical protein
MNWYSLVGVMGPPFAGCEAKNTTKSRTSYTSIGRDKAEANGTNSYSLNSRCRVRSSALQFRREEATYYTNQRPNPLRNGKTGKSGTARQFPQRGKAILRTRTFSRNLGLHGDGMGWFVLSEGIAVPRLPRILRRTLSNGRSGFDLLRMSFFPHRRQLGCPDPRGLPIFRQSSAGHHA